MSSNVAMIGLTCAERLKTPVSYKFGLTLTRLNVILVFKMQGPPNEPPPQYAAYPRQGMANYGTADKLRALADGYYGLNKVFLLNIALVLANRAVSAGVKTVEAAMMVLVGSVLVVGLIIGFATYPSNKKIGYGANWSPGMPIVASVLMALNSALCCGIIGYVVVQSIAAKEMSKYGLKAGLFGGLKKPDVERTIAQFQAQEAAPAAPAPYPNLPPT
jgi:hypothetical protein